MPVVDRILMIFVYRCDVIPFDMTGNNNDTGGPIDEKSNQWFGASISSSGDDGVIVVRLSFFLARKFGCCIPDFCGARERNHPQQASFNL